MRSHRYHVRGVGLNLVKAARVLFKIDNPVETKENTIIFK